MLKTDKPYAISAGHRELVSDPAMLLRSAGLVRSRRDGNTVFYRLADTRVLEAYRLIQSLARLGG